MMAMCIYRDRDAAIDIGAAIGGGSEHDVLSVIERGVRIGSGARVRRPVLMGNYAAAAPSAMVLDWVPDYGAAVRMPARLIRIDPPRDRSDYTAFR